MDIHAIKSSLQMQDHIPRLPLFGSAVLLKIKTISLLVFGVTKLFRLQQDWTAHRYLLGCNVGLIFGSLATFFTKDVEVLMIIFVVLVCLILVSSLSSLTSSPSLNNFMLYEIVASFRASNLNLLQSNMMFWI